MHPTDAGLFQGTNFMTPEVRSTEWIVPDLLAVEVSTGRGFSNEPIFGVTFQRTDRRYDDGKPSPRRYLSGMVYSHHQARERIEHVRTLIIALRREP